MKATNDDTDHNRTIRLSEIPIPAEELRGASPLFTELTITVNYVTVPNDGQVGTKGVTLDRYVIPALLAAINNYKPRKKRAKKK
jgi:hypothetical protein